MQKGSQFGVQSRIGKLSQVYKDIICFLQLRDIALKRFQLAELDDLPSVVFASAFLATAGKTITELSFHSKVNSLILMPSQFKENLFFS